ncbi:MAG: glycosyltransferase family 87 protein [Nevskia sp.]
MSDSRGPPVRSSRTGADHWLDRERLRVYPIIFLVLYLVLGAAWVLKSRHGIDINGKPLGYDFIAFWSASKLVLAGHAADAYDVQALGAAELAAMPGIKSPNPWQYPPTFLLLVAPLSLLPYLLSYVAFIAATLAGYLAVVRRIIRIPGSLTPLLAFPGIYLNLVGGQNAFLTAALIGAALLSLEARPVLAGLLLGLLTIKPHLGLLVPIALVCGGHWRALASAAITAIAFLALSAGLLGSSTAVAFVARLPQVADWVAANTLPLAKMPTFFSLIRLPGLPIAAAYAVQAVVAAMVAAITGWLWRRGGAMELRNAALVAGSLLTTPYLFDYDLAWLALAIAWFTVYALRSGWRRGERELLVAAWLLPMLVAPLSLVLHLQASALVVLALFLMIARRALASAAIPDTFEPARSNTGAQN